MKTNKLWECRTRFLDILLWLHQMQNNELFTALECQAKLQSYPEFWSGASCGVATGEGWGVTAFPLLPRWCLRFP